MNRIILAVDGGATKTTMTIRSTDGEVLFTETTTGSNYQAIGRERVQQVFASLLEQAATTVSCRGIHAAAFAIAGIDTKEDTAIVTEIVRASLASSPFTVEKMTIENDVEATLLGAAGHSPASLLISGTGAICFSYNRESIFRTGGWGHRAGDEGSGYWLGQQIVQAIFRAEDGRGERTSLTELVLSQLQLGHVEELLNWLYHADYTNAKLASVGSLLQKAVEQGDAVALSIARRAGEELALLAGVTLRKASYTNGAHTFYLNGGVLKNNPAIYETLVQDVHKEYPHVHFSLCDDKPIEYIVKRALVSLQ
ncbi:N-acetylglucosamine kinase [Lysinibacillus sp. 54212]|uniref:N-acetylglucosamine kinase n=1 Tax=Lysinibacillus sp. 54212 TaxID=3119829 RepID=UPI002FC74F0A